MTKANPDEDGLTRSHFEVYWAARHELGQQVAVLLAGGIEIDEMMFVVVDLEDDLGMLLAISAFGPDIVTKRVDDTDEGRAVMAIPLTLDDGGVELVTRCWPAMLPEIIARDPGSMPTILVPADEAAVLTFTEPDRDGLN